MHTPVPHALPARVLICNTLKNITDRYARSFIIFSERRKRNLDTDCFSLPRVIRGSLVLRPQHAPSTMRP